MIGSLVVSILHWSCGQDNSSPPLDDQPALALEAFKLINQHRTDLSLDPLSWNETIAEQCRIHSRNMAQDKVPFGHDGFQERLDIIKKTIPYSFAGENVAWNQGVLKPAENAVEGWLASPGHRENIEGDYTLSGMGVAGGDAIGYYFTQIFIKPQ